MKINTEKKTREIIADPRESQHFSFLPYKLLTVTDVDLVAMFTSALFVLKQGTVCVGMVLKTLELVVVKFKYDISSQLDLIDFDVDNSEPTGMLNNNKTKKTFQNEAFLLKRQKRLKGVGFFERAPFHLSAFIPGYSLNQFLAQHYLSDSAKLCLAIKIVKEVQKLHEQKITHGDLSLEHIRVTYEGEVVLVDFDIAVAADMKKKLSVFYNRVNYYYPPSFLPWVEKYLFIQPEECVKEPGPYRGFFIDDIYAVGGILASIFYWPWIPTVTCSMPLQSNQKESNNVKVSSLAVELIGLIENLRNPLPWERINLQIALNWLTNLKYKLLIESHPKFREFGDFSPELNGSYSKKLVSIIREATNGEGSISYIITQAEYGIKQDVFESDFSFYETKYCLMQKYCLDLNLDHGVSCFFWEGRWKAVAVPKFIKAIFDPLQQESNTLINKPKGNVCRM